MTERCLSALSLIEYTAPECFRYCDELILVLGSRRMA